MGNPKFVIQRSEEQFHFNLVAGNGEIILTSERYTRASDAREGIASVKLSSTIDARYVRKTSVAAEPYFVLRAGNNEVVGTSEMYSSPGARDEGIAAVKANAPGASVEDRT